MHARKHNTGVMMTARTTGTTTSDTTDSESRPRPPRACPLSSTAFLGRMRLYELKEMNLAVIKTRCGNTAAVREGEQFNVSDISAEVHRGGAPGRKMCASAPAV